MSLQTVLLVDDDAGVLEMVGKMLRRGGYAVVSMSRSADALAWWREHHRDVRAVVTDVVMPGMSGLELVDEFRKDRPDVPVMLISGYPDRVPRGFLGDGAILQKPFTSAQLLEALSELVGA